MASQMIIFVLFLTILSLSNAEKYNNLADVSCGQSEFPVKRQARIVGGEDAVPWEFPWLVSITRKGGHFCGGTILNSKFVLTAAHCFCSRDEMMPVSQLRVTLGEHNLKGPELPGAITTNVNNRIVHPDFTCGKFINDVALLELSAPIEWSVAAWPACLPPAQGSLDYNTYTGESATAAGWGWLGENKTIYSKASILQKVGVHVIKNEVCDEWYASKGKFFRVKYGQMCAGHENGGRDSCGADSGGPLMVNAEDNKTVVIGIVSSGIGCARERLPGVYTRISEFIPWIVENVKK